MITVLSDIQPIARKKYKCDACELFLDGSLYKEDMDESDYETVLEAKKMTWRQKRGISNHRSNSPSKQCVNSQRRIPNINIKQQHKTRAVFTNG